MTHPIPTAVSRPGTSASRAGPRRVLVVLCATEITSWGVLFYAFPVLAAEIVTTTGWSMPAITAAFSLGQVAAAVVGIPLGRWLDRHGPRGVMTTGSVLAAPALVLMASAPDLGWFVVGWLTVGVAMGAVLYPPAFAALTRWHGPDRVRALTVLTLAGGLASTVFAPATALLSARLDWRDTYLVLAVVLAVITVPAHWFGLRLPWPPADPAESPHARHALADDPRGVARSRPFLVLAVAFSAAGFAAFAVVIGLVPLLIEHGMDTTTAAVALGLGGAGQVAGRLGYPAIARHTTVRTRTVVVLLVMAAATALLGLLTNPAALVVAAIGAGTARGVLTLLQATAVTDRWGSTHYGRLTGLLSAPVTVTMAIAPFSAAALAELFGSHATAFLILAAIATAAAALIPAATPHRTRVHREADSTSPDAGPSTSGAGGTTAG